MIEVQVLNEFQELGYEQQPPIKYIGYNALDIVRRGDEPHTEVGITFGADDYLGRQNAFDDAKRFVAGLSDMLGETTSPEEVAAIGTVLQAMGSAFIGLMASGESGAFGVRVPAEVNRAFSQTGYTSRLPGLQHFILNDQPRSIVGEAAKRVRDKQLADYVQANPTVFAVDKYPYDFDNIRKGVEKILPKYFVTYEKIKRNSVPNEYKIKPDHLENIEKDT